MVRDMTTERMAETKGNRRDHGYHPDSSINQDANYLQLFLPRRLRQCCSAVAVFSGQVHTVVLRQHRCMSSKSSYCQARYHTLAFCVIPTNARNGEFQRRLVPAEHCP